MKGVSIANPSLVTWITQEPCLERTDRHGTTSQSRRTRSPSPHHAPRKQTGACLLHLTRSILLQRVARSVCAQVRTRDMGVLLDDQPHPSHRHRPLPGFTGQDDVLRSRTVRQVSKPSQQMVGTPLGEQVPLNPARQPTSLGCGQICRDEPSARKPRRRPSRLRMVERQSAYFRSRRSTPLPDSPISWTD